MLNVHATRVKDLDPLRDMPLKWLDISDTAVRDLAPIQNSPLRKYGWITMPISSRCGNVPGIYNRPPWYAPITEINGSGNFRERREHE